MVDDTPRVRLARGILGDWTIPGTDLVILRSWDATGWRLTTSYIIETVEAWLNRHQLGEARFRRRKDLLRAYQAAAAIDPPPAQQRPVHLRRIASGRYEMPDGNVTVTKTDRGQGWIINDGSGPLEHTARTLEEARAIIRLYCLRWD